MFQRHAKFLFLALFLIPMAGTSYGQTSTVSNPRNGRENSPYSKFGIGELQNGNNTTLRAMGNFTSAYASPFEVNTDNPASYSFLKRTTFEVGATASSRNINATVNGASESYTTGTATLSYINIAFPATQYGGLCFGFRPFSHVYYSLVDTISATTNPVSPIGTAIRSYNGEGALNQAFVGGAVKYKGLSLGFNLNYTFGTVRNTTALIPADGLAINNAYSSEISSFTRIGGLNWKGGILYEGKIDSTHVFRIGGTVAINQNLNQRYYNYQASIFAFSDTVVHDTVSNTGNLYGNLTLPTSYSIGIMFAKTNKWGIGADYTATQWNTFKSGANPDMNINIAASSYKISLGGEYTPNINDLRNYFSKVTYRLGAYYGTDYLNINNTEQAYYGITAGASLPFKRSTSHLHLAIDAGTLGSTANGLIRQNYLRFTLGVSFNDLWFIKTKYE